MAYRKDPENCGHGGTIHLAGAHEGDTQCKLCGMVFDKYGNEMPEEMNDA